MSEIPDCKENHNTMSIQFIIFSDRGDVKVLYSRNNNVDVVKVYVSDELNPYAQKVWMCQKCSEIIPMKGVIIPLRGDSPPYRNFEKYFPKIGDIHEAPCPKCKKKTKTKIVAKRGKLNYVLKCTECSIFFRMVCSTRNTENTMNFFAKCKKCKKNVEILFSKDELTFISKMGGDDEYECDLNTKKCPKCDTLGVLEKIIF